VRSKNRKAVVDQVAAQQILQLYLDRERARRARGE
jgi:RNase H-fold protein (predicted Holliday junction resolvase)